jgi:hypothetical protein
VTCEVCGPGDTLHTICHPMPGLRAAGCGHALADHTPGLRCRVCLTECGVDPRALGFVAPTEEGQLEPAHPAALDVPLPGL